MVEPGKTGYPLSKCKKEAGLAAGGASDSRLGRPPATPGAQPFKGHLQRHLVSGANHPTKPHPFHTAEQGELSCVPLIGQKRDRPGLGQCLELEDPRKDRVSREVPGQKGLLTCDFVTCRDRDPRLT